MNLTDAGLKKHYLVDELIELTSLRRRRPSPPDDTPPDEIAFTGNAEMCDV